MATLALPSARIPVVARGDAQYHASLQVAQGTEGRSVFINRQEAIRSWYDRSEYLGRRLEDHLDPSPAVPGFPITEVIRTRFFEAGRLEPLPFPETDD